MSKVETTRGGEFHNMAVVLISHIGKVMSMEDAHFCRNSIEWKDVVRVHEQGRPNDNCRQWVYSSDYYVL
jgi:hypothetical protein